MIKKTISYTKIVIEVIELRLKSLFLYIKHLFLIKTLKVNDVIVNDLFVIEGTEIEILWDVKGCHKIKIEGITALSGNIHGVKLMFYERLNPIKIKFYGVRKKVQRTIKINSKKIDLLNDFSLSTHIPQTDKISFAGEVIESQFTSEVIKSEFAENNLTIVSDTIYLNENLSKPLRINHKPFKPTT